MSYFVGAYASSPNVGGWDQSLEKEYYDQLKALGNVKGLEHPFVGQLHPNDDEWFLNNLDSDWDLMFTCVPGIMGNIGKNPHFGIASENEEGRLEAIVFMKKACDAIAKVNAFTGKQTVKAIEIQTSPNRSVASASSHALKKSLETMLTWDWQGAQIVIEHCDAYVEGQKPAKGFLSIEDEIQVLSELNDALGDKQPTLGIVVNWGRSAIETRSIEGPVEHIKKAKQKGVLAGVMFSGASDKDSAYGVWSDTHMPPSLDVVDAKSERASLLTETEIQRCLESAGGKMTPPSIVGVKIGIRPREASLMERVTYNKDALAALDRFYK